ncbi:MAG: histidinol phosphate phosphatase, partial [Pseudomonadota bacterium]|nr:histidinol phosphate phosphatase [Pseudomonadota bacterium]
MDYNAHFGSFFAEAADAAGITALKHFRQTIPIDEKQDRSPVTQADREIERVFRDQLRRKYPDHGIIGEEFGQDRPDAEFVWVIDPIDGTRAFMTGKPL